MALLIRNIVVGGETQRFDLRVRAGTIVEVAPGLSATDDEHLVEGHGQRIVPALADDHLHIGAWLRAMRSALFPPVGLDEAACRAIDRAGPAHTGWSVLFGIDHQHVVGRQLECLDAHVRHPVLLVHRTGHAAFANARGRAALAAAGCALDDIGRCWRLALGPATPMEEATLLRRLRAQLLAAGVADIRDATPYRDDMASRAQALADALAPIRVSFMAAPDAPLAQATHVKLLDPAMKHHTHRPVAVHAVEPYEIHCACGLVDERGRIEHASVCPESLIEMIAARGCTVCANPGFLVDRSAALQPMRDSGEAEFFQPLAELRSAGVKVTFGSDAPVGEPGPWSSIRGAQSRGDGELRFPGTPLSFDDALRCAAGVPELVDASAHGWLARRADFALIDPGDSGLGACAPVRATVIDGRLVHHSLPQVAHHV